MTNNSQYMTPGREAARDAWRDSTNRMLSRPAMGKRKITSSQRDDIIERGREGEDPKDLALEYSITASYVRELIRK